MTPLFVTVAVGLFGGLAALVIAYTPYRKHKLALRNALESTIRSITREGRHCNIAITEDFHEHKRLLTELRPFLIIKTKRFDTAVSEYEAYYNQLYRGEPVLLIFNCDIELTLNHLATLRKFC